MCKSLEPLLSSSYFSSKQSDFPVIVFFFLSVFLWTLAAFLLLPTPVILLDHFQKNVLFCFV